MASTATPPPPVLGGPTALLEHGPGPSRPRGPLRRRTGSGRLRDVRPAPAPARPAAVPIPGRLADPGEILAARLAVTDRPQPDGWRRDALVYAMVQDAAQTREKGRPQSAAVVLGTIEASRRLAKREGKVKTTGRDAAPDNTSFRRSLVRLQRAGLIDRVVINDEEDQERWTVVTLLPLPAAVDELVDRATALLTRWLDERPARWFGPLRRLARRRAERAARAEATAALRDGVDGANQDQGACPVGSSPTGAAFPTKRSRQKKVNASTRAHPQPKLMHREKGGEAGTRVGMLMARLGPLLAPLTASEADRVGNDGLGFLTRREASRWARTVDRWLRVRHLSPGWEHYDAYDAAERTAFELTGGHATHHTPAGDGLRFAASALTTDERNGYRRPRPIAVVARAMHVATKQLAAIAKDRAHKARLHQAAGAAVQAPVWVETDTAGRPLWRTGHSHIVLRARWLPTDVELARQAPQIRALIHLHPSPLHHQVPTSIGIVDRHGNYVRAALRRARDPREHTPPHRPVRHRRR